MTISMRLIGWVRCGVVLFVLALLTGCAAVYVDNGTKEIAVSQFKKPDQPRPVQVLVEFQTKGAANARATAFLKDQVVEQVKNSGLFGAVVETPSADSGLLSITINNIPLTNDAASKGFVTGLTFGLAGSSVADGYVCVARYSKDSKTEPVVAEAHHVIHTTLGASSAPPNATKAGGFEDAVRTMARQIVSNVLNDLSHNPTFK